MCGRYKITKVMAGMEKISVYPVTIFVVVGEYWMGVFLFETTTLLQQRRTPGFGINFMGSR